MTSSARIAPSVAASISRARERGIPFWRQSRRVSVVTPNFEAAAWRPSKWAINRSINAVCFSMSANVASFTCDCKSDLLSVRGTSFSCTFCRMESTGSLIRQWRLAKGWKKRPPLVKALAEIGVKVTAEAIRQYEEGDIRPGREVRAGLAKVFGKEEWEIEFAESAPSGLEEAIYSAVKTMGPLRQRALYEQIKGNRRAAAASGRSKPKSKVKK